MLDNYDRPETSCWDFRGSVMGTVLVPQLAQKTYKTI